MDAEALREDVAAGRVIVVAGTGVSVAASGRAATADWAGLMASGIDASLAANTELPAGWESTARAMLTMAIEGHLASATGLASLVVEALGGKSSAQFASWLRSSVGELSVQDDRLVRALDALAVPIVTTNYDGLIEQITGRAPATWQETNHVQRALRDESNDVVHLHGFWRSPESVIFSSADYGVIGAKESIQALERAVAATRTLVFVGVGAGLQDPNFGTLVSWLRETFRGSEQAHYRLCLDSEVEVLRVLHAGDHVFPIGVGPSHGDLPRFLEGLGTANKNSFGLTAVTSPVKALESLCGRVRSETVLAEHLRNVETATLNDILVPPILLPLSPEQFAAQQSQERGRRPKRCDANADVTQRKNLLLVAEENAGLTSALEWLIAECHSQDQLSAPVHVDFKQLKVGHRPLERQIRRELVLAGAIGDLEAPLPPCALAIDNLSSRPTRIFERVLAELASGPFPYVVLGCKQGAEAEVHEALNGVGLPFTLRYLGRYRQSDARRLAELVEPARAEALAEKAMEIVQREHLPRTPITISLLLTVLLHGEARLGTANETALLDAYVQLLLGRGDPHDDARVQLDAHEKADILETLAERYVAANAGSLPEADVIAALQEYFDEVTWDEDPVDTLNNFRDLRILSVRGGQVRFTQSTFLHLFAARRAMQDDLLKQVIFGEPLYYAPIIRHYAALTRNDPETLLKVEPLLEAALQVATEGHSFRDLKIPGDASVEELLEVLDESADAKPEEPGKAIQRLPQDEVRERYEEMIERISDDDDLEPFPLQSVDDTSDATKTWMITSLVSSVLRDSELVRDQALKLRMLRKTLQVWGTFVKVLDESEVYADLIRDVAASMADVYGIEGDDRKDFIEEFVVTAPVFTAMGGMSLTLASRKLTRLLDMCFGEEDFLAVREQAIMAALLAYDLKQPQWAKRFNEVRERYGATAAVNLAMHRLAIVGFYSENPRPGELDELKEFLIGVYASRLPRELTKDERSRVEQALTARRRLAMGRRREREAIEPTSAGTIEGEIVD